MRIRRNNPRNVEKNVLEPLEKALTSVFDAKTGRQERVLVVDGPIHAPGTNVTVCPPSPCTPITDTLYTRIDETIRSQLGADWQATQRTALTATFQRSADIPPTVAFNPDTMPPTWPKIRLGATHGAQPVNLNVDKGHVRVAAPSGYEVGLVRQIATQSAAAGANVTILDPKHNHSPLGPVPGIRVETTTPAAWSGASSAAWTGAIAGLHQRMQDLHDMLEGKGYLELTREDIPPSVLIVDDFEAAMEIIRHDCRQRWIQADYLTTAQQVRELAFLGTAVRIHLVLIEEVAGSQPWSASVFNTVVAAGPQSVRSWQFLFGDHERQKNRMGDRNYGWVGNPLDTCPPVETRFLDSLAPSAAASYVARYRKEMV